MAAQGSGRLRAVGANKALDLLRQDSVGTAASDRPMFSPTARYGDTQSVKNDAKQKAGVPNVYRTVSGMDNQVKEQAAKPNPVAAPKGVTLESSAGRPGQDAVMEDMALNGKLISPLQPTKNPNRPPPIAQPSVQYEAGNASGVSADYIGQSSSVEPMDRRTATVQYGEPGHEFMGGYQRWRQLLGK